jgi:uracil-DNA glycosylase family 4
LTIRFPPDDLIKLHEAHEGFRVSNYSTLTPTWFSYMVGNELKVLPQAGMTDRFHMPVTRVGASKLGWDTADFMLVLPFVRELELAFRQPMLDEIGAFLKEQLRQAGISPEECMVTHALRFAVPDGMTYGMSHKLSCQPYVKADCYACAPKAILTFGADALKSLFGNDAKMDKMRGSVHEWHGIPVIPTVSPLTFSTSRGGVDVFQSELTRALQCALKGYVQAPKWYEGYRVCETAEQVEALEQTLIDEKATWVSIDTEFGNDTGRDEHNYILTFQLSWGPGKAALIKFRGEEGVAIHSPETLERIKAAITRMFNRKEVRLIGQHLRVDVDMAYREGMDFQDRLEDGFDTMLAHWILYGGEGDESHGLDHLVRRYEPDFGAYWMDLENWLDSDPVVQVQKRKRGTQELVWEQTKLKDPVTGAVMLADTDVPVMVPHKRSRSEILQYGYRLVPHELLVPYALLDADVTYRIAMKLMAELAAHPDLDNLFKTYVMPISLHLMDVERQGIKVDEARIAQIRAMYEPEYNAILEAFRTSIKWPSFNPNSPQNKATFLFSKAKYKGKKDPPKEALLLALDPLYNTAKYPKEWSKIIKDGQETRHSPSTKAATLDLLYQKHKENVHIKQLKQLSVLGKFLSTYLTEPGTNEHGYREPGKNIGNNIWADGRVRGHFNQMTATGRYSMRAANLQTNPKRQEEAVLEIFLDRQRNGEKADEYKRRTNDKNKEKLGAEWIPFEERLNLVNFKTAFVPEPGNVLIEVDFKTAEICVWAYCSGDQALIDIIAQGRDLHAEMAAIAFQLPVLETMGEAIAAAGRGESKIYDAWVGEIKTRWPELRVAAKTVNFGVMYGRAEYALSREISKATGKNVTPEECTKIIRSLADRFPTAWAWLQTNMQFAIDHGYVANAFDFRRYFHGIQELSQSQQAAARREASNSPIQGTVAFLLGQAGVMLRRFRYKTDLGRKLAYKVCLPIHDAFLIEVGKHQVKEMTEVIHMAMSTYNCIPGTDKHLDVDIEVFPYRWGEKKSKEEMIAFMDDDDDDEEMVA